MFGNAPGLTIIPLILVLAFTWPVLAHQLGWLDEDPIPTYRRWLSHLTGRHRP